MGLSSLNGGFPIYTGSITMNILDLTGTITYKERTFHCQVWFRRVLIWSSECQIRLAAVIFGFIQQSLPPEKSNPVFLCFLGDSHQMKTSTTSEYFTVDSPVGLFSQLSATNVTWWIPLPFMVEWVENKDLSSRLIWMLLLQCGA